ncbi:MAG: hypothetical protein Q8Q09_12995 [Deltaproteobacteria bacterium]|nr:hypothetical protein [Deltaproteobacteria bacterium]
MSPRSKSAVESEPTYGPRTVAIVAVGSLIVGFVLVFGGGMLVLKPQSAAPPAPIAPAPTAVSATPIPGDAQVTEPLAAAPQEGNDPTPPSANATPGADPIAAVPAGSVTVGVPAISRCFAAANPTPIPGANCGSMAALQQHIVSKQAALAACARGGHGRLALVLEFRFSTSFVRGWGGPTSTIPRAGDVTLCAKQAVLPLPLSAMAHDHDRYLVTVALDF